MTSLNGGHGRHAAVTWVGRKPAVRFWARNLAKRTLTSRRASAAIGPIADDVSQRQSHEADVGRLVSVVIVTAIDISYRFGDFGRHLARYRPTRR
jgi:hypothetical protein